MTPSEFGDALRTFCLKYPASVTSWGRTPARNALVGGHPRSYHMLWLAADIVYDAELPPLEDARQDASRLGMRLVREGTHDHLQALPR